MSDFIAAEDRALLERHGLADYDALWALKLEAVDEPNTERGGCHPAPSGAGRHTAAAPGRQGPRRS